MNTSILSTSTKGDFEKTLSWLKRLKFERLMRKLESYGEQGVAALANATPVRTGLTATSWSYEIEQTGTSITITWKNSNLAREAIPIALLIQYGHATRTGGYVQGLDYINPALKPIFDEIITNVWKEITKL